MQFEQTARDLMRPAVRLARELPAHRHLTRARTGQGPMAVFLPARGPEDGASLLRIYHMGRALRACGWRSFVMPWKLTLTQRKRLLARAGADLLVMQGSRHALNRPRYYPDHRILYDIDDADFHLPHLAEPVRRAMGEVEAVLAGSRYIAEWCRGAGAKAAHVIWTGAPLRAGDPKPQAARARVLVWGQTRPMTYRREADLVARVVHRLAAQRAPFTLRLFDRQAGDDLTALDMFRAPGVTVEWVETLRYSDYIEALQGAALGLAPLCPENAFSRGKSFGKVLAYMDAGVPVLASDAGEHGRFFTADTGVVSNEVEDWVRAAARLLADAEARQSMADAARLACQQTLSLEARAKATDQVLRRYLP